MRQRPSTVVVFVVVAVAWLAAFYSTRWAYLHSFQAWDNSGSTTQHALGVLFLFVMLVLVLPTYITVAAIESVSGHTLGDWFVGGVPLAVGLAVSAATWATLATVAYFYLRHLRERRAASKEA